jgi:hypothetical protein
VQEFLAQMRRPSVSVVAHTVPNWLDPVPTADTTGEVATIARGT